MNIHDYYYNEDNGMLLIELSTKEDGNEFYREIKIEFDMIKYYSPIIIDESFLTDIDGDFISDLLKEYLKENELPEQQSL